MAAAFEYETLEALLDKCTDPNTGKEDWRYINAFCDRVNKDYDGPLISTKLIIRKLQTFQEKVSLMALSVLEACVKYCGQKYHQEIGKFRFLNELIKLLSNKEQGVDKTGLNEVLYDGSRTPQSVKQKIIEMFYSWSVGLPSETKIKEAYLMLKRQGVVVADPQLSSQVQQYKPNPQPRMAVFEDEDKAKLLSRLLASKHPDDLQAANRLIKNMVRQDELRVEKINLRVQELEMVQNNVKLLKEMLSYYSQNTPHSDMELMKELYDSCERLRTNLFKTAGSATEEGDETLSEILRANDDVTKVIEDYRRIVGVPGEPPNPSVPSSTPSTNPSTTPDVLKTSGNSSNISSLIDLDIGTSNVSRPTTNENTLSNGLQGLVLGPSNLPGPQVTTGLTFPPSSQNIIRAPQPQQSPWLNPAASSGLPTASMSVNTIRGAQPFSAGISPMVMPRPSVPPMIPRPPGQPVSPSSNPSWSSSVVNRMKPDEKQPRQPSALDLLGQQAMNAHKETQIKKTEEAKQPKKDAMLLDLDDESPSTQPAQPAATESAPVLPPPPSNTAVQSSTSQRANDMSLDQISVPLDSIQPGSLQPMNILEKNSIKTVMHFAKDSSGSLRSDIHVVVVSTMSTNTLPLKNFTFQCAAPKSMKIKLQPPTSNELPGYNPILPPSAITQVMLLANPAKDRIRLKFRISYDLNGTKTVETGDLENFPIL